MANVLLYPRFKAWAEDGTPLAAGKVYTYVTGTSTPATTYTNGGGATPNANPVILDSNGEADIWGAPATSYRILIKTSADVQVGQPIDNVAPITPSSTLLGNLNTNGYSIVSSGSNNITLTPGGSGAVVLDGLTWPTADGTNNQVIKTNGSGALSFVAAGTSLSADSSPQLSANLDFNTYNALFDNNTGIKDESGNEQLMFGTTASAVNYIKLSNAATGNNPTFLASGDDTNISMTFTPKGTGAIKLSGIAYPVADGTSGQVIVTNGSGTLSFSSAATAAFIQRQTATGTSVVTCSTALPVDDTIPQNTEGDEVITLAITPTSATNILTITCLIPIVSKSSSSGYITAAIFQDSTAGALASSVVWSSATTDRQALIIRHKMVAGTTSATTFKVRVGPNANTAYVLGDASGTRIFGGVAKVVMTIDETTP